MTLPERDVAKGWQGRLVLDQDGERLGECTGIFADAASGATEWLEVAVQGHRRCLLPALNALEVGGQVRVAFRRAAVLSAPHVGDDTELSKRDDIALYRHYGVHYSASASPSLLPTEADLSQPKTADLPVTPTAKTADLPVPPTGKPDRDTPTQPPPPPPVVTPPVVTPRPPLVEADTRPHVVQAPTPSRRPTPAAPTPVRAVPTSPVSPGPTASSTSPQASPAPTPPPTPPPGPQAEANDPPVVAPKPMPAPIRPPAPVGPSALAQVAKPAQPVPVPPKAPVQGLAASMAGESSPGPTVPSQQAQPASASASSGAETPRSGAEPLGPLAGAWASGAPLAALAALAAAVAFGLRARDQRVAAGPTTSVGRRRRPAPSRTRAAPAARRRTGSTSGTSARKPRVRAAAGSAKHGSGVGRLVRRQLRRLATGDACAAGYLRGARAGRQRYDQLRTQAEQLGQHPQVQAARQAVTDPQARKQAWAQARKRYRSSQEQYRSARRQATELVAHPQVRLYRKAVTDPHARRQVFSELRAHPQVQRSRQAITDPQVRQQVLTELREKADQIAAGLKKRLG